MSAELRPGERVTWRGAPDPKKLLCGPDALLIPFTCAFVAVTVLMTVFGGFRFLAAWMALLWLVCAYYVVGRFVVKRWSKRRTTYVLTDHRALVLRRGKTIEARELRGATVETADSFRGRHCTVSIVSPGGKGVTDYAMALFSRWRIENTGLDFGTSMFATPRDPLRFFDLPSDEAKEAARLARAAARA